MLVEGHSVPERPHRGIARSERELPRADRADRVHGVPVHSRIVASAAFLQDGRDKKTDQTPTNSMIIPLLSCSLRKAFESVHVSGPSFVNDLKASQALSLRA